MTSSTGSSTATNTVADTIALTLIAHGVTEAFGQSLPSAFFLAAERHGIRQVSYRTENAGGAMADAAARISNRTAVVGAQNGPAATLLVAPLAEAMKVSIPVLALIQEVPTTARDKNAFQELDHRSLFAAVAKSVNTLTDPARTQEYVEAALREAATGRPGPVVLLLPKDLLSAQAPAVREPLRSLTTFPLDRVRPESAVIAAAADAIAAARRPLVVAGGGVHGSAAVPALTALQEQASLPVATTNMGKGAVSEQNPLSLGVIGNAMGKDSPQSGVRNYVQEADLVLFIGTRTNENATDTWRLFPDDAVYVHIDIDGREVGRNYRSFPLVGDAALAILDLTAALGQRTLTHLQNGRKAVEAGVSAVRSPRRHVAPVIGVDGLLTPQHVATALDEIVSPETTVVADASYSTLWVTTYLTAKRAGQRFLTPRGLAGLGWGLPMALGAQVVRPAAPVVCLSGDGGFGHVWAELETAVREELPVTLVLLNNGILGFQRHAEFVAYDDCTSACDFAAVDHSKVAEAVGVWNRRVTDVADLKTALAEAVAHPGPALVEVFVSPNCHPPITAWQDRLQVLAENQK